MPGSLKHQLFDHGSVAKIWHRYLMLLVCLLSVSVVEARYGALINEIAQQYGIDADLVHAIVRAESAYQPNAVSHAGAVGLMQLMEPTARRFGVNDRYDPRQNISGGVRYLRYLTDLYGADHLPLILAAYNAGESAVSKYGGIPPFRETKAYVPKVMRWYRERKSDPVIVYEDHVNPSSPTKRYVYGTQSHPVSGLGSRLLSQYLGADKMPRPVNTSAYKPAVNNRTRPIQRVEHEGLGTRLYKRYLGG